MHRTTQCSQTTAQDHTFVMNCLRCKAGCAGEPSSLITHTCKWCSQCQVTEHRRVVPLHGTRICFLGQEPRARRPCAGPRVLRSQLAVPLGVRACGEIASHESGGHMASGWGTRGLLSQSPARGGTRGRRCRLAGASSHRGRSLRSSSSGSSSGSTTATPSS